MTRVSRRLLGAFSGLAVLSALLASAAPASVPVDLRVVSNESGNLADVRQYVAANTTVKTFAGDDCFGSAPPFEQSSGTSYLQRTPTMLAAIWEAGQVKASLQPVRITDADYLEFGALGVCQIGAKAPPGYFFLKSNHSALTVGAGLFTLVGGEELLTYRTPADFSVDEELELTAPTRTAPGAPITVNVRAYAGAFTPNAGSVAPKVGARVTGGAAAATTDANGNATVSFTAPGNYRLVATGEYNDIPSAELTVCVAADPAQACPEERGREILGSDEGEGIKGTGGGDTIRPRAGEDRVKARDGSDLIVSTGGGGDFVDCGGGKDVVVRDGKDKVAKNCEKVKGKKRKGKKKGGSKK